MKYEIYSFVWLFLLPVGISQTTVENFGPYKLDWLKYETCTGPKKGECGTVRIGNTQNMSDVVHFVDVLKDCPMTKGKVTIHDHGKTGNKLLNYRSDKPCQHFVLGPVLEKAFKLNNTCKLIKGHYDVHLNLNGMLEKFLGSRFFYGTYALKLTIFNSENNIFCHSTVMRFRKP